MPLVTVFFPFAGDFIDFLFGDEYRLAVGVLKVVAWLIAFRGVRELHTCHGGPVFDYDVAALIEKTLFILGRGLIILAACFPVSVATHYRKSVVC